MAKMKRTPETETKDNSPRVYTEERINFDLDIREFNWNPEQKEFIDIALHKDTRVVICAAKAGTGKTLVSLYVALQKLKQKKISKIYFVRNPIESASGGIGYTPGTSSEKMMPYLMPALDNLNQLLPQNQIKKLFDGNFIEVVPLGFVKGRTLCGAIVADEAEDLSRQEFLLVLGRISRFSNLFLIGDIKQSNIKNSGFKVVYDLFDDEDSKKKGIHCLKLKEVMRNDFLSYVVDKFETLENQEQIWQPKSRT